MVVGGHQEGGRRGGTENVGLIIGFGIAAVSYTHLRAHETVLDLVCRLLLEKKKNNTSQSTLSVT